jgi:hypothetical protein
MDIHARGVWLPSVLGRTCVFLFVFTLLILSLFIVGNFQSFLDATQIMLLDLFEGTSLLYIVAALFYAGSVVVFSVRRKKAPKALPLAAVLVAAGGLAALHWVFSFLLVWLKPVN